MINVKSEKGFYFKNPQDYLDGKINDLNDIRYNCLTFSIFKEERKDGYCGWGSNNFKFITNDSIEMTKEALAAEVEKLNYDFPFFIQKKKLSEPKYCAAYTNYKYNDLQILEKLENQYGRDLCQISARFRETCKPAEKEDLPEYVVINWCVRPSDGRYLNDDEIAEEESCELSITNLVRSLYPNCKIESGSVYKSTSKIINGKTLSEVKDINNKIVRVGDSVYYSRYGGRIEKGKVTGFTDISIKIDGCVLGKVSDFDLIKC